MTKRIVKADLHNHLSTSSRMRQGWFNKLVDITEQRLGPGGIVAVVNFNDHRYEDIVEQPGYERHNIGNAVYVPHKDVLIVKGQEVPTDSGHLLVLGISQDKHISPDRTLKDTIVEAKENNGAIIMDHPFYVEGLGKLLKNNPCLLGELDAIEIYNGEASLGVWPLPRRANAKALDFFRKIIEGRYDLGAISASDGHSFYEVGRSWTAMEYPNISSYETLSTDLRNKLRNNNGGFYRTNSFVGAIGALDHTIDLVSIIGLARMGIKISS